AESAAPGVCPVESKAANAEQPEADAVVDGAVVAVESAPVESAPQPAPSAELPAPEPTAETAGDKAS
ncbi:MAG: NADH-quinone oxidoreductase subunit I, partial [Myxococcaceae bacterium]|nr:NADH-quinone oxidoreductase subunit I [Myxococcaceae bacterium]